MDQTVGAIGDWLPEYARAASVEWRGQQVFIRNIRNATYRTRDDYTVAYYDACYEPDALQTVDLVVSRWAGNAIAHVFVSFGFADGRYLAISIETRRRRGQKWSKLGGFFKNYPLIYVLADERDLIGVRTDIRRERLSLYRGVVQPDTARALFRNYLQRVDELNRRPEFYHTLFNNCTTNILRHARSVQAGMRYSWKVLLSGYADRYAYELGLLDSSVSFDVLQQRCHVIRSTDAVIDEGFSHIIRGAARATAESAIGSSRASP